MSTTATPPTIRLPFTRDDFPDARLLARAQTSADALARALPTGTRRARRARRGTQRLIRNRRIDAPQLLAHSADPRPIELLGADDVVLVGEDTSLVRAGGGRTPRDAGALRSAGDRGYVLHAAVAIDPASGWPLAWMGADAWTRRDTLRLQDHKGRAPGRKESRKWARRRRAVVQLLRTRLDAPRRLIHLTDREGDCWASLLAAVTRGDRLITRVAQRHRAIAERKGGVQRYLEEATPVVDRTRVTVRQWVGGVLVEREATLTLRWAPVTVQPPKEAKGRRRRALRLVAVWVREDAPPIEDGAPPIDVLLFTTVPTTSAAGAWRVARWYLCRWGVEIAFDLLKNGCALEAHAVTDIQSFRRLTAVTGPTAVQVAAWIAGARASRPPPVAAHFDAPTLAALRVVCEYERLPTPPRWSLRSVVRALGRLGGWEPRARSPEPGWRVVLRGWRRFAELRDFAAYLTARTARRGARPRPRAAPQIRGPS